MTDFRKLKQRRDFLLERIDYEWYQRCGHGDMWANAPAGCEAVQKSREIIIRLINIRVFGNLKELAAILKKPWPYKETTAIGVIYQRRGEYYKKVIVRILFFSWNPSNVGHQKRNRNFQS
jgi:hypothetical protein